MTPTQIEGQDGESLIRDAQTATAIVSDVQFSAADEEADRLRRAFQLGCSTEPEED